MVGMGNGSAVDDDEEDKRLALAGVDNGDPLSFASFQGPELKLLNGKAMIILRSKPGEKGPGTVTVSGKGIKNTMLEIKVE